MRGGAATQPGEVLAAVPRLAPAELSLKYLGDVLAWISTYALPSDKARADELAWPDGPRRVRVVDALLAADVDLRPPVRAIAGTALLALMVPADAQLRSAFVMELLRYSGTRGGPVSRIVGAITRGRGLLRGASTVVSALTGVVGLLSGLSGFLAGAGCGPNQVLTFLSSPQLRDVLISGLVISRSVFLAQRLLAILASRLVQATISVRVGAWEFRLAASDDAEPDSHAIQHPRSAGIVGLMIGLVEAIDQVCFDNSAMVRAILVAETCPLRLRELLLDVCRRVRPEVAREALAVLPVRSFDAATRGAIMRWLCQVEIVEPPARRSPYHRPSTRLTA